MVLVATQRTIGQNRFLAGGRYEVLHSARSSYSPKPNLFTVVVAYDHRLQQQVILKSVNPISEKLDAQRGVAQLEREADFMRQLEHWRFSRLLETFKEESHLYLVIDFIEGETLSSWLARQPCLLPTSTVLQIGLQVVWMLSFLHSRQRPFIHRDLKPLNLMVTKRGKYLQLVLIDFGNARYLDTPRESWSRKMLSCSLHTDTFPYIGSWGYAPPEQCNVDGFSHSGTTTSASDIYSLGVILHQLLSGEDPSQRRPENVFTFSSLERVPRIPQKVATLLDALLQFSPESRPKVEEVYRRLKMLEPNSDAKHSVELPLISAR